MRRMKLRFRVRTLLIATAALCLAFTFVGMYRRDQQTWKAYTEIHALGFTSTVGYGEHKRYAAEFCSQRRTLTEAEVKKLTVSLSRIAHRHEIELVDLSRTDVPAGTIRRLEVLIPDAEMR